MVSPGIVINRYPNQAYKTIFNQKTGLLIRLEDEIGNEPFWCSYGPELMDISITNWCDKGCSFCYKESDHYGIHINVDNYQIILHQAAQMKVLQIAIGGGNPNQHPNFCEILRITREEYNIIPSYTTNGRGLCKEILDASKEYCAAVAVSAYEPFEEMFSAVQRLLKHGIRTNIHFLLTSKSINTAIKWLENPPQIFKHLNAIIFLNYKAIGRNPSQELLTTNAQHLFLFFQLAGRSYPFKIGFDCCSISGVSKFMDISPLFIERCEAGRFSMYISEDMKLYPCSFMINKVEGVPITKDNIQNVWRYHISFIKMRELLHFHACQDCTAQNVCFGGCPIYPEINMCSVG